MTDNPLFKDNRNHKIFCLTGSETKDNQETESFIIKKHKFSGHPCTNMHKYGYQCLPLVLQFLLLQEALEVPFHPSSREHWEKLKTINLIAEAQNLRNHCRYIMLICMTYRSSLCPRDSAFSWSASRTLLQFYTFIKKLRLFVSLCC